MVQVPYVFISHGDSVHKLIKHWKKQKRLGNCRSVDSSQGRLDQKDQKHKLQSLDLDTLLLNLFSVKLVNEFSLFNVY